MTTSQNRLAELLNRLQISQEDLAFVHPAQMGAVVHGFRELPETQSYHIGSSGRDQEIYAIQVGTGDRHVLATACAHADEPTGTLAVLKLVNELAKDEHADLRRQITFHCLPMLDPDGVSRNWGWMTDPISLKNLCRFSYRGIDPAEDLEHCLPLSIEQDLRPEARAFKEYIDSLPRLDSYVTLHNLHLAGGPLFAVTAGNGRGISPLTGFLSRTCRQHDLEPMDENLYGRQGITRLAPGFVTPPLIQDMREAYRDQEHILQKIKMTTYQYASESCGAKLSLITEIPLFVSPDLNDSERTHISRYDLELELIRRSEDMLDQMRSTWKRVCRFPESEENRFWIDHYETLLRIASHKIEAQRKDVERYKGFQATRRELFDLFLDRLETEYKTSLMALRRLQGLRSTEALAMLDHYQQAFDKAWDDFEKRCSARPVPLASIIRLQIAAILAGPIVY
jgi:hypothetical protein